MQLPEPGDVFAERYHIEAVLGRGGFSRVFRATDLSGEVVALKVLTPDNDGGYRPNTVARFRRESAILQRLSNPHTVRLLDGGVAPNSLMYLAFEYLKGQDLSRLLHQRGVFTEPEVQHVITQLLLSLDEAHRLGLVHRDLKPQNIRVVDEQLHVKLIDFGIARATDEGHPSVTRTGELVGTPRYMSPEQLRGHPLDARSDLYSLGMIGIEMLCGSDALPGGAVFQQIDRLHAEHQFAPDASGKLVEVLRRMTAGDPKSRYANARAVLHALSDVAPVIPQSDGRASRMPLFAAVLIAAALIGSIAAIARNNSETERRRIQTDENVEKLLKGGDRVEPEVVKPIAEPDLGTELGAVIPAHAQRSAGCREGDWALPLLMLFGTDMQRPDTIRRTWFGNLVDSEVAAVTAPADPTGKVHLHVWREAYPDDDQDLQFVRAHFEHLSENFCFDRTRVYIVGNGDGARIARAGMCEPWVTAVAVHGYAPEPGEEACDQPKPLIWLHPLKSGYLSQKSGETNCNGKLLLSPNETQSLVRKVNRCDGDATDVEARPGGRCFTYACDAPLVFCEIHAGRAWPRDPSPVPRNDCVMEGAGPFPISDKIWEFFKSVPALELEP